MHKLLKTTVLAICLITLTFLVSYPAFAADTESSHITETVFFGNVKDDGSACGVFTVINLVVDILSIGIGILAAIGITISGIKYLTAGGNEEQTRKAKHRMYQIVIGLVAYAILYVGAQWLMPGGKLNFGQSCTSVSDSELAKIKEKERKEEEKKIKAEEKKIKAEEKKNSSTSSSKSSSSSTNSGSSEGDATCLKKAIKIVKDADICEGKTASERIARTAAFLAWPKGTSSKVYRDRPTPAFKKALAETVTPRMPANQRQYPWAKGRSCSVFAATVVRSSGYDKTLSSANVKPGRFSVASINYTAGKSQKWKKVSPSKAVRGDIFAYKDNHHVMIYGGKKGSKYVWYQGDKGDYYGYTSYGASPKSKKNVNVWHAVDD